MDNNLLIIIAITLLALFFLFGFNDCKSCCTTLTNASTHAPQSQSSSSINKEGFCGCNKSESQSELETFCGKNTNEACGCNKNDLKDFYQCGESLFIKHKSPAYYGLGPWGFHYGEPYYYNEIKFTNY